MRCTISFIAETIIEQEIEIVQEGLTKEAILEGLKTKKYVLIQVFEPNYEKQFKQMIIDPSVPLNKLDNIVAKVIEQHVFITKIQQE